MTEFEERLADALTSCAQSVASVRSLPPEPQAAFSLLRSGRERRRPEPRRWLAPVAAAASIALVAAAAGLAHQHRPPPGAPHDARTARFVGALNAVAARTASDAWAVGTIGSHAPGGTPPVSGPLVLHWNGADWQRVPTPDLHSAVLTSVSAPASNSAWAVGWLNHNGTAPLILHWNGKRWSRVNFPGADRHGQLNAVAATSPTDVWAVGSRAPRRRSLVLHWDGTSWTSAALPYAGVNQQVEAVTAGPGKQAWIARQMGLNTVVLHWTGSTWSQVSGDAEFRDSTVTSLTTASDGSVWAVGVQDGPRIMTLRRTGSTWRSEPGAHPAGLLTGVATRTPSQAWAVGLFGQAKSLFLHWNGTAWSRPKAAERGFTGTMNAIAADRARDVWVVGNNRAAPVIFRWNGKHWQHMRLLGLPHFSVGSDPSPLPTVNARIRRYS